MTLANQILNRIKTPLALPAQGSWPASTHRLDKTSAHAIIAAVSARRPLLVRGDPGTGKSQLARAAADLLGRCFLSSVIQPNSEYEELLWSVDYTERLADAQLAGQARDKSQLKPVAHYVSPGPVWYALNWQSAAKCPSQFNFRPPTQVANSQGHTPKPQTDGVVLLIDEIDKADINLANGLLEVLGNGQFDVRHAGATVKAEGPEPLIVLTSNDTRQLPAALLRRCVVLEIKLPEDPEELKQYLVEMGQAHFPKAKGAPFMAVAEMIVQDRLACHDLPRTGLAEYLDLLRALDEITQHQPAQWGDWLKQLAPYFSKSSVHP